MPTTGQVFKNRKELAILIKMPTTGQVFKKSGGISWTGGAVCNVSYVLTR